MWCRPESAYLLASAGDGWIDAAKTIAVALLGGLISPLILDLFKRRRSAAEKASDKAAEARAKAEVRHIESTESLLNRWERLTDRAFGQRDEADTEREKLRAENHELLRALSFNATPPASHSLPIPPAPAQTEDQG